MCELVWRWMSESVAGSVSCGGWVSGYAVVSGSGCMEYKSVCEWITEQVCEQK